MPYNNLQFSETRTPCQCDTLFLSTLCNSMYGNALAMFHFDTLAVSHWHNRLVDSHSQLSCQLPENIPLQDSCHPVSHRKNRAKDYFLQTIMHYQLSATAIDTSLSLAFWYWVRIINSASAIAFSLSLAFWYCVLVIIRAYVHTRICAYLHPGEGGKLNWSICIK
jgi:hypothetical protein